jgi:hypothetical protein
MPFMTQPQTQPTDDAVRIPDGTAGFKVRYVEGGSELVSATQGRHFVRNRQITIGIVKHLLLCEKELGDVREDLNVPDGMPTTQHAAFVSKIFGHVVERVGLDRESRTAEFSTPETILSEYDLAATAKLRDALEVANDERGRLVGRITELERGLAGEQERARQLEAQLAESDAGRLRQELLKAEEDRDATAAKLAETRNGAELLLQRVDACLATARRLPLWTLSCADSCPPRSPWLSPPRSSPFPRSPSPRPTSPTRWLRA